MQREEVTGLILAGGASRRFGTDKARFPIEGRPMIARVYEAVAEVVGTVLLSVGDRDGADLGLPVPSLVDRVPGAGPLAGLHAGLHAAATPWLLVVACDMPFLTPGVLRSLLDQATSGTAAVVAQSEDGRLQPLCACYHASVLPRVEAHLHADRRAMWDLLEHLDLVRHVLLPTAPLRNINHRTDLDAEAQ